MVLSRAATELRATAAAGGGFGRRRCSSGSDQTPAMSAAQGKRPQVKNPFAPFQIDLSHVRITRVSIRGGGRNFRKILRILKERERKISPFEVEVGGFRVHATPLENPGVKRTSFHILRLYDPLDDEFEVDLLIQDVDLYFVAFRRQRNGEWGIWFTFSDTDERVRQFLGGTKIYMSMGYNYPSLITPGGSPEAFEDIMFQFANFEDDQRITHEFKSAAYSIMVIFCETRRLLSLMLEISTRIDLQSPNAALSASQFEMIQHWSSASGIILTANNEKTLDLGKDLPKWWPKKLNHLKFISCLIGARGELLILKFNRRYVRENDEEFNFEKLLQDPRSARVPNPDFVIPQ
ncbi:hypothetical protein EJB05_11142, partial [Eragrostis curvula]